LTRKKKRKVLHSKNFVFDLINFLI
jgi:hypothetical protein